MPLIPLPAPIHIHPLDLAKHSIKLFIIPTTRADNLIYRLAFYSHKFICHPLFIFGHRLSPACPPTARSLF